MENRIFNLTELKKTMMNIACPLLEAFYSDIILDFETIEGSKIHDKLYWAIRKNGTHCNKSLYDHKQTCSEWEKKILVSYEIENLGGGRYTFRMMNK